MIFVGRGFSRNNLASRKIGL